jgi:hypothetical protein
MVAVQAVTTHLALHVHQQHRQDMLLLTLAAAVAQAVTTRLALLVWHPQTAHVMLSFLAVVAAPVGIIHRARVVQLTNLT